MARSYQEPTSEAKLLFNAMIPFLTARTIGSITANRPLYICVCFQMAPFKTARSSREPTTIAQRIFPMPYPFLTAPAIEDKM